MDLFNTRNRLTHLECVKSHICSFNLLHIIPCNKGITQKAKRIIKLKKHGIQIHAFLVKRIIR